MKREELEQGIFEALFKATLPEVLPAPDDVDGWARWVQTIGIYMYEFAIRFKERGMKFEKCQHNAWYATKRRVAHAAVDRILSIRLPREPEGTYATTDWDRQKDRWRVDDKLRKEGKL